MSLRERRLVLAAVTTLAVSGCGAEGQTLEASSGVTVLVSAPKSGGMDALGGGTLEIVGGCLGADGQVVVWPPGTEVVNHAPVTIEIPGRDRAYAIGDQVRLGGGYVSEPPDVRSADALRKVTGVEVPQSCLDYPVFLSH